MDAACWAARQQKFPNQAGNVTILGELSVLYMLSGYSLLRGTFLSTPVLEFCRLHTAEHKLTFPLVFYGFSFQNTSRVLFLDKIVHETVS